MAGSEATTRPTGEELASDGVGVLVSFSHQVSRWASLLLSLLQSQ